MLRLKVLFLIVVFLASSSVFAEDKGYFNIQNGSEYLGFSSMSKEFRISSLMNSAIANDAKATKIFIASGAEVNQKNMAGATALHLAARNNSFESAQILIENGARVNEKDGEGWTPLMRASLAGNPKMMKLLIENGAQIWYQNNFGETALMHTAMADCYECGQLIVTDDMPNTLLARSQISESLQIVNKRYNEPFIELLTRHANTEGNLVLSSDGRQYYEKNLASEVGKDTGEAGTITQLVYIFTGKTVSEKEITEIEKSNYDKSVREQKKPVVVDMETEEKKPSTYNFKGTEKKANEIVEEKTVEEPSKYKLNSTMSTPVIEEKKPAATYNFNGTEKNFEEPAQPQQRQKEYNFNGTEKNPEPQANYSFNSGIEEKKNNMRLVNSNDKLNPDYVEYTLKSDEKTLNN